MCDAEAVRAAEREFAKKLRDENARLNRLIAEREARDAEYFEDVEIMRGRRFVLIGTDKA